MGNSPKEDALVATVDHLFTVSGMAAPAGLLQKIKSLIISLTADGLLAPEIARQEALRIVDEAIEPLIAAIPATYKNFCGAVTRSSHC